MIKERVKIPRLLFEGGKEILAYPLFNILERHTKGYLVGDTNYGKQDLTLATKIAGAEGASKMLRDNYEDWGKPIYMMIKFTNEQFEFLKDDVEISIELIGEVEIDD